mmetsp:Transcript_54494/g.137580  ORF Transcript_54494/g.137580 Transcript_54494/m.137580 type:complete len:243 (-) Transcript_54494:98-826(-)
MDTRPAASCRNAFVSSVLVSGPAKGIRSSLTIPPLAGAVRLNKKLPPGKSANAMSLSFEMDLIVDNWYRADWPASPGTVALQALRKLLVKVGASSPKRPITKRRGFTELSRPIRMSNAHFAVIFGSAATAPCSPPASTATNEAAPTTARRSHVDCTTSCTSVDWAARCVSWPPTLLPKGLCRAEVTKLRPPLTKLAAVALSLTVAQNAAKATTTMAMRVECGLTCLRVLLGGSKVCGHLFAN